MIETGFGDMARYSVLRRAGRMLKQDVARLSGELSSGQVADKPRHLSGDLTRLSGLKRAVEQASVHQRTAESGSLFLGAQQAVIHDLLDLSQKRFQDLIVLEQSGLVPSVPVAIDAMAQGFSEIVGKLNISVSGRTVFAGVASDQPALAGAAQLLDALVSSLPPGLNATDLANYISDWFLPGGGFDTAGYSGGQPIPEQFELGQGVVGNLDVTAQEPAIRKILSAFATGAVLSRDVFAGDLQSQQEVLVKAGQMLANSSMPLTDLSARIGFEEEKHARATSRAIAEKSAMSIALSALREADPYETATRLEQAMVQLDTVYTLTARLSRLSLVEYLR